jgi:hypothetical protein
MLSPESSERQIISLRMMMMLIINRSIILPQKPHQVINSILIKASLSSIVSESSRNRQKKTLHLTTLIFPQENGPHEPNSVMKSLEMQRLTNFSRCWARRNDYYCYLLDNLSIYQIIRKHSLPKNTKISMNFSLKALFR